MHGNNLCLLGGSATLMMGYHSSAAEGISEPNAMATSHFVMILISYNAMPACHMAAQLWLCKCCHPKVFGDADLTTGQWGLPAWQAITACQAISPNMFQHPIPSEPCCRCARTPVVAAVVHSNATKWSQTAGQNLQKLSRHQACRRFNPLRHE